MSTSSEPAPKVAPPAPPSPQTEPAASTGLTFPVWGLATVLILVGFLTLRSLLPSSRPTPTATEWEYLVQPQNELNLTGGLPERGPEKWELVAVEGGPERTYYFKRPKAASNPATARILQPTGRWEGRLEGDVAKQPMPEIKGPKSLAEVWQSLRQPGEVPAVDFSTSFVQAASSTGNSVNVIPVLYRNGDVRVSLTMQASVIGAPPQSGSFVIAAFPRNDVKSINGQPLRSSGPND